MVRVTIVPADGDERGRRDPVRTHAARLDRATISPGAIVPAPAWCRQYGLDGPSGGLDKLRREQVTNVKWARRILVLGSLVPLSSAIITSTPSSAATAAVGRE